jgi:hypothetical protein
MGYYTEETNALGKAILEKKQYNPYKFETSIQKSNFGLNLQPFVYICREIAASSNTKS